MPNMLLSAGTFDPIQRKLKLIIRPGTLCCITGTFSICGGLAVPLNECLVAYLSFVKVTPKCVENTNVPNSLSSMFFSCEKLDRNCQFY